MNDSNIRNIIRSEITAAASASRFGISMNSNHAHTGLDSPQINQDNIIPGSGVVGSITFAQQTTYTIGLNFNPSLILIHGNVTGALSEKFLIVGNVKFGPSFHLQPGTSTSVITGGLNSDIIQSTSYFGNDSAGALHTLVDEFHIVDVFYGGTIHARATVASYSNKGLVVQVDNLDSGWAINLAFTIT